MEGKALPAFCWLLHGVFVPPSGPGSFPATMAHPGKVQVSPQKF